MLAAIRSGMDKENTGSTSAPSTACVGCEALVPAVADKQHVDLRVDLGRSRKLPVTKPTAFVVSLSDDSAKLPTRSVDDVPADASPCCQLFSPAPPAEQLEARQPLTAVNRDLESGGSPPVLSTKEEDDCSTSTEDDDSSSQSLDDEMPEKKKKAKTAAGGKTKGSKAKKKSTATTTATAAKTKKDQGSLQDAFKRFQQQRMVSRTRFIISECWAFLYDLASYS